MNINTFQMRRDKAHKLWKEYIATTKKNKKDEYAQDMKKVYSQLKSGRKLVDIKEVFERGGIKDIGHPNLAITPANASTCFCRYRKNGSVTFSSTSLSGWRVKAADEKTRVTVKMPALPEGTKFVDRWNEHIDLTCLVPMIPASVRPPKAQLKDYYVLWEVDEWKLVPPRDPYLLRRITPNMFVVVAGWNLTELERAVMKGRVS